MKLGIMQPYLFPYLGYWQAINAVDQYVLYDDVNFIKGGWINRNNILLNNKPHLFTLSLDKASPFKKINEIDIVATPENRNKVLGCIRNAYLRAPYFKQVFPIIENIINYQDNNLASFLLHHTQNLCDYMGIRTRLMLSSNLDKDNELRAQDKVIHICKMLGANQYINAIGGQELYNREAFATAGIRLDFIKMHPVQYTQFGQDFVPYLSIIDMLMFNDKDNISIALNQCDLI